VDVIGRILGFLRAVLLPRAVLVAEKLALRQQLAVLQASVIGSIRRECLDHLIVRNEAPLVRILTAYFGCYHEAHTHLSLDRNAPTPREVEPPSLGGVIAIPQVGGLFHRYTRAT
jgi:hypothetical protein